MARQETTNTFTEGLMSDFNPVNVPNNALTDCLNGTIITYDGNEMSLQNDKGNFPLTNCKLKENYIPVGIKEYGDILYIVSYNPIDNKVEVGSYPSTTQYSSKSPSNTLNNELEIPSLNGLYSNIIKNVTAVMFVDKNWTLHPGDEYYLEKNSIDKKYIKLEYYIMDENKQLVRFEPEFSVDSEDYKNYKGTPGWLVVKPVVANIDKANINIRSMDLPEDIPAGSTKTATCKLVFSVQTSDGITDSSCQDFVAKYTIGDITGEAPLTNCRDLYNGSLVFYSNVISGDIAVKDNSVIKISFKPELKTTGTDSIKYKEETLEVKVSSKFDISEFNLGNSYWKYSITDQNQLMLTFNTKGMESVTNTAHFSLKCTVSRFVENNGNISLYTLQENGTDREFSGEWSTYGNSTYYFPLTTWTGSDSFNKDTLYKEDLYVVNFTLYEQNTKKQTISKLVVASEIMNGVEGVECYDDIDFDTILQRYLNTCYVDKYAIEDWNPIVEDPGEYSNVSVISSEGYNLWSQKECPVVVKDLAKNISYNACLSDSTKRKLESFQNKLDYCFTAAAKTSYSASFVYKPNTKLLTGPLWANLVENAKYKTFINGVSNETITFNKTTGNSNKESISVNNISGEYKQESRYILKDITPANLFNYENRSLEYQSHGDEWELDGYITAGWSYNGTGNDARNYRMQFITTDGTYDAPVGGNTAGTIATIRSYVSKMFEKYDVALVKIQICAGKSGKSTNGANIWWDDSKNWYNKNTHSAANVWLGAMYLAFKDSLSGNTVMRLVPVKYNNSYVYNSGITEETAKTIYNAFKDSIKNIQCTVGGGSSTEWSGSFITVEKSSRKNNNPETVDLNVENELQFGDFNYLGIDMLKDKSAFTKLIYANNLINPNGDIDLPLLSTTDTKTKNIIISDNIKNALSSALDAFNEKVESQNKDIIGQISLYLADPILAENKSGVYNYNSISSGNSGITNAIISQLNGSHGETKEAQFRSEGWKGSSTVATLRYVIAKIDADNEIEFKS